MYNLKVDYGAVGDGITNDYTAINNFLTACMQNSTPGYIPPGRYLSATRITINAATQATSQKGLRIHGAGAHCSVFVITDSVAPSFHLYKGTGDVFSYVEFRDFGIECNSLQGFVVCLSDYSDFLGNGVFKNLHIYNANSSLNDAAVACQLNYLFDCIFENCVFITNNPFDYGSALEIRNVKFTVFTGGSYSNAKIGILFSNSGSGRGAECLTFTSADFENTNYCIRNLNSFTRKLYFTTPYFDNRRPNTSELGIACVSSPSGNRGCIVVDNPEFAIPGTGLYPDTDRAVDYPNSAAGAIVIRGAFSGFVPPDQPSVSPFIYSEVIQPMMVSVNSEGCLGSVSSFVNNVKISGSFFLLKTGDTFKVEWVSLPPTLTWSLVE